MSTETQSFTRLLPKETRFITGENPSPTKLNGTFVQIENAFTVLESFLGNGIDFHVTNNDNRKILFNISSAIGRTDKLYKPINCVPSLSFVDSIWGADATSYSNEELVFESDILNVSIPVNATSGYELGIYYTGQGKVLGLDGTANWVTLSDAETNWKWAKLDVTTTIKFFKLIRAAGKQFKIKSLYLVNKTLYNGIYNKGYSLPIDNGSYYAFKIPCKYSSPTSDQPCEKKTCNYCIGQTYEYDKNSINYGQPKCVSYASDPVDGAHWINSGNPISISYTPEPALIGEEVNERATLITVQSPLLTNNNQYAIQYIPFHMHSLPVDTELPQNSSIIYDAKNSSATIKYLTRLYSAGGTSSIRSDIMYIKDTSEVEAGIGDPKRFIVAGGNYGLIDLMYDIMKFIYIPTPTEAFDDVAVYSG